jgi:hypothetical protein
MLFGPSYEGAVYETPFPLRSGDTFQLEFFLGYYQSGTVQRVALSNAQVF